VDESPDPTRYGFAFWATRFFENLSDVIPYVTDIPDPQPYSLSEVDHLRGHFTPEQFRALSGISKREFLLSESNAKRSFFSVPEVCFAYVYDTIMFGIDDTCESHWTIGKISATLAWFDLSLSAADTVMTALPRCMVYPMYRNYSFAKTCWELTVSLFKEGKAPVLKCLLRAQVLVQKGEHRWRLNRLYIEPMICFIQDVKESEFSSNTEDLASMVAHFPREKRLTTRGALDCLHRWMWTNQRDVFDWLFKFQFRLSFS
jgi:protein SHQ1